MKQKKICPSCGLATFGEESFCTNCGENLKNSAGKNLSSELPTNSGKIICAQCGFENEPSFNFCGKCGEKLNLSESNKQIKPKQKRTETKSSIPNNMIYSIVGLFVILVVFIYIINQREKTTSPAPVSPSPVSQPSMQQQQPPMMDMKRINDLKAAIASNPNDKASLLELANLFHDGGSLDMAIFNYKKYLDFEPKDPDARVDMATCYFAAGDHKTAIAELEKVIANQPKHQKAYYNLGIVTLNTGDFKKSIKYFEKCAEIDPNSEVGKQSKELIERHKGAANKPSEKINQ